ncbi:hypothetical protein [Streptomyces sp. NPDC049813]|uniref:hypothetical protein n=1 Tax=Streptomyces sp. NPDC049813 TaxID=3365597 RepID=UPI0037AB5186
MTRMRAGLVQTAAVLALSTAAAALATGGAAAADRLEIVSATAVSDHVEVTVRYRCEPLLGTDTLGVALTDLSRGGIYTASATPTCDNAYHRVTLATARTAGPLTAAHRDAAVTASLGASPDPHLMPTASTQATVSLKGKA